MFYQHADLDIIQPRMAFCISPCIGLTTPNPGEMVAEYTGLFGMQQAADAEGLRLEAGFLSFYVDPGQRQPPILELLTKDLASARALLRAFGCQEQAWNGESKLNLVTDRFGIAWNIHQGQPTKDWLDQMDRVAAVPAKIALHLHEGAKAAAYYAELLGEPATHTPGGWTIDSNHVRIVVEPGLPHGPAFYADAAAAPDPEAVAGFFAGRTCHVDRFGITWKAALRDGPANAVVEA